MTTLGPDEATRANVSAWERFATAVPGGWSHPLGGAVGVVSGVELPGFNGVWGEVVDVDPAAVAQLLDEVRSAGVPHCLELRQGWPPAVAKVARDRGFVRVDAEPVMVLQSSQGLDAAPTAGGLTVRRLAPDEGELHARIAAAGGVVGREIPYRKFASPEVLGVPGLRCYIGEVDGEPVTTAIGYTTDDCVGIFAVATLPAYRRRGYGAAVTAHAARGGLDAGARWAWLAASAAGFSVYAKLGFVTIDRVDIWQRAPAGRRKD